MNILRRIDDPPADDVVTAGEVADDTGFTFEERHRRAVTEGLQDGLSYYRLP